MWFRGVDWDAVYERKLKPPVLRKKISLRKKNIPKDLLNLF